MSLRKVAGLLAAFGLMVGLIGGGVGAVFSDQVTAEENVNVGTFACQITDATAGASIAPDHKSVSYTAPTIMSSAAGSAPFSFTVQNSGSIAAVLTVTTSAVGAPFSIIGAPFAAVPVAPSGTHMYDTGVQWGALDDTNLGQSGAVTWTVDCGEVPIPAFGAAYYVVNDGGAFGAPGTWCRSASPIASTPLVGGGTGTQSISGGSLAVSLNDVVDYADSGFYVPLGPLGSLTSYAIAAVGAPVTANIYLDTSGDGQFFAWTDECLSGLGGDAYGSGPSGTAFTIDDSSSFQMFTGGGTLTIAQLKAGNLAGVTASTQVAVWVGIAPTSGSVSTTITTAP